MKKLFGLLVCASLLFACGDEKSPEVTGSAAATDKPAALTPDGYEFADAKFTELAKKHMTYLETADIDGWMVYTNTWTAHPSMQLLQIKIA